MACEPHYGCDDQGKSLEDKINELIVSDGDGCPALNINIDSINPTFSENLAQVNGSTVNVGTGAAGAGTQRVAVSSDTIIGVNVADGSDIALGAKADAAASTDTGTFSLIALFKRLLSRITIALFPSADSASAPSADDSAAYEKHSIVKAAPGVLHGFSGYNSLATDQFIQVHNSTTLPADGAVPLVTMVARAQSNFSWQPPSGRFGKYFSVGIVICNSSTGPTKTVGADDCWFNVDFS